MRKIIIAATVAIIAAVSFAAPSQAGGFSIAFGHGHHGHGWGGQIGFVDSYYGGPYHSDYYEPYCFIKKVRRHDHHGNLFFKRIRVCR